MLWRNLIGLASAALAITGLVGCGFQPLYESKGVSGSDTVAHLAAIRISPIPDRSGQRLRNSLQDKLTPRGKGRAALYKLEVLLKESRSDFMILQDATSTLAKMRISAKYVLNDIRSGMPLTRGTSESTTIFNIVESGFANLNAQSDARARAVNEISHDIRLRLGLFFKRQKVIKGGR
jgi:LPS-assembly lipoprotein